MNTIDFSERTMSSGPKCQPLWVARDLRLSYQFSLLIATLTAIVSLAGLLYAELLYPTLELRQSFLANDAVNLIIGLPILLGSMWLARRGRLAGLLFWPGAVFYGLYNYLTYTFSMPFNALWLLYMGIVLLSVAAIIGLIRRIDARAVKQRLEGRVPERLAGGFLLVFGALFLLRSLWTFAVSISSQTPISRPEAGLLFADTILSIPWIVSGLLLWRHKARGYVWGAALLFQASALFVGLIAILVIQPGLSGTSLLIEDVIVIVVMSLVCFIPFGLFTRGIIRV